MKTSSRTRPQSRPTRTLEHAREFCPSEHEADRIADAFGLDQVDAIAIRASTKANLCHLAGPLADHMTETGLKIFLQRLVAGFVDSACRTGEFYDAKVAEARRANAKLHCEDRDEDRPGVAGFDSRAQRTREFAAKLIAFLAVITCTFGNLTAYGQTNMKRLLAYSTIAHAGYMMMPVAAAVAMVEPSMPPRWMRCAVEMRAAGGSSAESYGGSAATKLRPDD